MGCRRTELAGSRAASGDREPHIHTPGTSPAAGAAAIPQPRVLWVAAPSLEHPPKPRARPVPRERYQEPACLVANRAGAGARSCVCACGCSGNSRPARNRAPGASQAARQQQAGRRMDRWTDRWTDGRTDGRAVAEHNQSRGVSAEGALLQSRVTARGCSTPWFRLLEGSGSPLGGKFGGFRDLWWWPGNTEQGMGHVPWASPIPGAAQRLRAMGTPVGVKESEGCGVSRGGKAGPQQGCGVGDRLRSPLGLSGRVPRGRG